MDKELEEILRKKALGYSVSEKIVEYDKEGKEVKHKITSKDISPDMSAIKILMDTYEEEMLTEAELLAEREKILRELAELYDKKPIKKERKNGNKKL